MLVRYEPCADKEVQHFVLFGIEPLFGGYTPRHPQHLCFVRIADEIVDSFHEHKQAELLDLFERSYYLAYEYGISPIRSCTHFS